MIWNQPPSGCACFFSSDYTEKPTETKILVYLALFSVVLYKNTFDIDILCKIISCLPLTWTHWPPVASSSRFFTLQSKFKEAFSCNFAGSCLQTTVHRIFLLRFLQCYVLQILIIKFWFIHTYSSDEEGRVTQGF